MASGKFVPGVPSVIDGLPEALRIHAGLNSKAIKALRESVDPSVDVFGHFVVADADHTFACGVELGVA